MSDPIFEPLKFRNLVIKNRIIRSSVSGRIDHYNGDGTRARINWDLKFAKGGVGAIISSFVPVNIEGRIVPHFASIHKDDQIPFWRELVSRIHEYDCKYILQLSHCGRQRDIGGVENLKRKAISSTSKTEEMHGLSCKAMTKEQIKQVIHDFGQAARRARDAGVDGIELHACHGYLITQFLSSGINDRTDEYGGSLENRARLLLEIVREIRKVCGPEIHLQVKINGTDYNDYVFPWNKKGNTVEDTTQVCRWLEKEGVDAFHISAGSFFPHPLCPPGKNLPLEDFSKTYGNMISWGRYAFRNFFFFRYKMLRPLFLMAWHRKTKNIEIEGINVKDAAHIKKNVNVPVMVTGGFQTASVIRKVINDHSCDAVTITRSLIANNNLVEIFKSGADQPEKPCTYCNKCLVNLLEYPVACYEVDRFGGDHDKMVAEAMTIYEGT